MNIKLPFVDGAGDPKVFWLLSAIAACSTGLIAFVLYLLSKRRRF
jgi:hypothetical protein